MGGLVCVGRLLLLSVPPLLGFIVLMFYFCAECSSKTELESSDVVLVTGPKNVFS